MSKKETDLLIDIPKNKLPLPVILASKVNTKTKGLSRIAENNMSKYDMEPLFKRISPI